MSASQKEKPGINQLQHPRKRLTCFTQVAGYYNLIINTLSPTEVTSLLDNLKPMHVILKPKN